MLSRLASTRTALHLRRSLPLNSSSRICFLPGKGMQLSRASGLAQRQGHQQLLQQQRRYKYTFGTGGGRGGGWGGGGGSDEDVLYGIIIANVSLCLLWMSGDAITQQSLVQNTVVTTKAIFQDFRIQNLFLANFSDTQPLSCAINSFILYSFGGTVIGFLGRQRFLQLYVTGGAFGHLCQAAYPLTPWGRGTPDYPTSGSGAPLDTIISWYIFSFPRQSIMLYGVFPLPAAVLGALWFGKDVYALHTNEGESGTAIRSLGSAFIGAAAAIASRGRFR